MSTINARLNAVEGTLDEILALLKGNVAQPAKTTRKAPAKKVARKATPKVTPTKGAQTRATLSRKDWNRTLTAKARFSGGGAYKAVLAQWETAQAMREHGVTPDNALEVLLAD